jgi:hypothetical protein
MNKWIEHILKINAKNKKERTQVGHTTFYRVSNNYFGKGNDIDLLKVDFYVRKKEGPVEVIKDRIWTRQYEIADAKKRLEEAKQRAEKAIELCGVIETDIVTLEDELEEMQELLTKNYPNEPR